jgi:hypothetical protein
MLKIPGFGHGVLKMLIPASSFSGKGISMPAQYGPILLKAEHLSPKHLMYFVEASKQGFQKSGLRFEKIKV